MFNRTRWSIRRSFTLALVAVFFTLAVAGFAPANAQTQTVSSASTQSAPHTVYLGRTFDQCSKTVVTVFTPSGPVQVFRGQTKTFAVHHRRIFWSCGNTPEATWLPVHTNRVRIHRDPATSSHPRRITWDAYFAY